MAKPWSSRERLLCTIDHREPDHVPLWNLWNSPAVPFSYRNQMERVEKVLDLGLDDTLRLTPPCAQQNTILTAANVAPGVEISRARQMGPAQSYPLLVKEYRTSRGLLRQVTQQTDDWPHSDEIPIFSDHGMARSTEFLINERADVEKLAYLLPPPSAEALRQFREAAKRTKALASQRDVLVEGGWIGVTDAAMWLCGPMQLLLAAMDDPAYVKALLQLLFDWQKPMIELLLEQGVDLITHRGWYETTRFWSPSLYRALIKPLLKQEIDLVHAAGVKYCYILSSGLPPLLDDLLDLGIDVLWGVDPVQGDADLPVLKEKLGKRVCLWGGMNSSVTLGQGSRDEIREAVTDAIRVLGPGGGFVLFPVDQLWKDTSWNSVEAMIGRWREIGSYPLGL